jgi:hypothetical protein
MSMKVKASHRYAHGVDTVYAAFCDPAFYQAKFEGIGARNVKVRKHEKKAGRFAIETEREVRVDVPAVLKSVLGEWNRIIQMEEWKGSDGEYHNVLQLTSPAVPVSIRGTMDLAADGKGCTNEIELEIRCDIPFIGKRLAELVAGDTERSLEDEHTFISDYLAGSGARARRKRK